MAADHGPDHGPRPVRAARGSSLAGSPIPAEPFRSDELMAYPDQLDFGVRQRSYTATRLLRGFEVRTTFLARLWVDLMFGVPERFRGDQVLYREIQKFAYPRLVSLPATSDDGGSATQVPVHPDLAARGVIDRLDVKSFLPGKPAGRRRAARVRHHRATRAGAQP